jgi:hemoglobin
MSTLFKALGGSTAINATVDEFYRRVLDDPRINGIFAGVKLDQLKNHQRRFLTQAFGGPSTYKGGDLGAVHRRVAERHGLNDDHFDAVMGHLSDTLDSLGVNSTLRDQALAIAESVRDVVLGRAGLAE